MKRVAWILGMLAALGSSVWAVYTFGPESVGGPRRVDLGEVSFAQLDTVSLKRRVVTASVTGRVLDEPSAHDVLIGDATGTFTVRLNAEHDVQTGETLLAVGRVRQPRGTSRRLDAVAWSEVEPALVPLQTGFDSVRLAPDSAAVRALASRDSVRLGGR